MSLARTLRLAVPTGVKLEMLSLQPQDFFVLSRVDRPATVAEIIGASGLGATQTEEILERLLELGALERVAVAGGDPANAAPASASPTPPRPRQSTQELRAQAQDRRKRLLAQQLGRAKSPTPTPRERVASPSSTTPTSETPAAPATTDDVEMPPVRVPLAAADDPRIDASLGIPVELQRELLGLDDARGTLTPFELLGLHPTDDIKQIRTAFRDASRRFHPDAQRGRTLGAYGEVLASLFAEAKHAHDQLQKPEVRQAYVDAFEAEKAELVHVEQQRRAAREAAETLRIRRDAEQQAERRAARASQRADRERERAQAAARAKVEHYLEAARQAEAADNLARAANNYRLALQLAPNDPEVRGHWERTRTRARQLRAKDAFSRATRYKDLGHRAEAAPLFMEAAEADPTAEHLAHAAEVVRDTDPAKARDLAIAALRSLSSVDGEDKKASRMRAGQIADLRLLIARAFISAGQSASARQQLALVAKVRPKDPEVPALLKSLKVT